MRKRRWTCLATCPGASNRVASARMKLPMHTTSRPVTGMEARRVLREATNPRAKAFAAEVVAALLAGADDAMAGRFKIR